MSNELVGQRAAAAIGFTSRKCTATSAAGTPCGAWAIVGGTVCHYHGGATPGARQAAQNRMLALLSPALERLARILQTSPPCETCGRSDTDLDPSVVKAIQIVLDRTGFAPHIKVDFTQDTTTGYEKWLTDSELTQITEFIANAERRMAAGQPRQDIPLAPMVDVRVIDATTNEDVTEYIPASCGSPEGLAETPTVPDANLLPVNNLDGDTDDDA
jgi:hypothetical protein